MPVFPPVTTATFPSSLLAELESLPANHPVYLQGNQSLRRKWIVVEDSHSIMVSPISLSYDTTFNNKYLESELNDSIHLTIPMNVTSQS